MKMMGARVFVAIMVLLVPAGRAAAQPDASARWVVHSADFNGDGVTDLLFYDPSSGDWYKGINTPGTGFGYSGGVWSPGWLLDVLDLNGDGLADVFLYNPTTGDWYRATTTAPGTAGFTYTGGRWSSEWEVHPLNINGDTFEDLFLSNRMTGAAFFALNDGVSGFAYAPFFGTPCGATEVQQWHGTGWSCVPRRDSETSSGLALVRGTVLFDGSIAGGDGFGVTQVGPGRYFVAYTSGAFSEAPTVLVQPLGTDVGPNGATAAVDSETSVGFVVHTAVGGALTDRSFKFIVAGDR